MAISIDWPNNPQDGDIHEHQGYYYRYSSEQNKWTSTIPPSFVTNTAVDLVRARVTKEFDFVNLESEYSMNNPGSNTDLLYYDDTLSGTPLRGLQGWQKISFPKTRTLNNDVIYIRAQIYANGYTPTPTGIDSPNVQAYITAFEPDGNAVNTSTKKPLLFFQASAYHESAFQVPSQPQAPYSDINVYAFLKVFEDPDNSNNFAIWHDVYRNSKEGKIRYALAGYMKKEAETDVELQVSADVTVTGTRGLNGVTSGPTPPPTVEEGDVWFQKNLDGSYTPKVYNISTGQFEETNLAGVEPADALPTGNLGEVYYINQSNTNSVVPQEIATVGRFVKSSEVAALQTEEGINEEIFNNWDRFSHTGNTGGDYPAVESELSAWQINSQGRIECTTNTGSYVGFYSPDDATDYTLEVTLSSSGGDDDVLSVVVAFVEEGSPTDADYRQHTISAVRDHGGFGRRWQLVYNLGQADEKTLANGNSQAPAGAGGWSGVETRVYIERSPTSITAYTSQFGSLSKDNNTELTFNLAGDADTQKFTTAGRYGYGAWSQNNATFYDIVTSGIPQATIFDVDAQTASTYNSSTGQWEQDQSVWNDFVSNNRGRFLINLEDNDLFYVDIKGNVRQITGN